MNTPQPKNILVITHGIPHPHRGASSVVFFWYIFGLKSTGHRILHMVLDSQWTGKEHDLNDYKQAIEEGMITLRGSGMEKVRQGITTIEEVVRETVK